VQRAARIAALSTLMGDVALRDVVAWTRLYDERRELQQRQNEAEREAGGVIVHQWALRYPIIDEHTCPRTVALNALLDPIDEADEEEEASGEEALPVHPPMPYPSAPSSAAAAAALPGDERLPAPVAQPKPWDALRGQRPRPLRPVSSLLLMHLPSLAALSLEARRGCGSPGIRLWRSVFVTAPATAALSVST